MEINVRIWNANMAADKYMIRRSRLTSEGICTNCLEEQKKKQDVSHNVVLL